ncbi:hypothetical protein BGZ63DRAFT_412787 [Mariannaea sp. PMI_226]|nr:hypothetical protein BGZ63DRAFT_412787 [Mariannaea sp. PMI_226]
MTDWSKLKVVDLRNELKNRGLSQAGLKNSLVQRLIDADNEVPQEETEKTDSPTADDQDDNASERTATEPEVEAADAKSDATAEDVTSQEVTKESRATPLETTETETPAIEDEQRQGVTKNDVSDDAQPLPAAGGGEEESKPMEAVSSEAPPVEPEASASPLPQEPLVKTPEVEGTPTADAQESQKRKRRSLTPPPTEDSIAHKRARLEHDEPNQIAPKVRLPEDLTPTKVEPSRPDKSRVDEETSETLQGRSIRGAEGTDSKKDSTPTEPREQTTMDFERDVVPSVHPATSALYIKNFMRPLRPNDVQAHLVDLATAPSDPLDDGIIVDFYLDQIRTHAFVVFRSTSAASRVRMALHDSVWPNESNRKPLWVDFVPPEKVKDWIEKEESSGRRSGARWEVVYEDGPDGEVEAHLESGAASFSRASQRPPPPGPAVSAADAIPPSGPRNYRENGGPPRGPRADRAGPPQGPSNPLRSDAGGGYQTTQARPTIRYQCVSQDLANRRMEKMRSHYTTDRDRDFGREINRYSFDGDAFVDRGKEIFEGIRPPHRERAIERERRGFGGGGGGGGGGRRRRGRGHRARRDRYQPGQGSGPGPSRDDRRPRYNDDDQRR